MCQLKDFYTTAQKMVFQDPKDEPASVLLEYIRAKHAALAGAKKPRRRKSFTQDCP